MNAYTKPRVETLRASQVVEAMGPAQGYGSMGSVHELQVYGSTGMADPYHFSNH